jgi:uncharacterized protein (TIGR02001 family)
MQGFCLTSTRVYSNQRTGGTLAKVVLSLAAMLSADSASSAVDMSALVRLTSNYEYRGYTLSNNHAAAQANFDLAWSNGFSLGSWVSSADFGGADLAANPYLGKSFTLSPDWQFVTSVAGHFFYEKVNDYNASYGEGALRLDYRDLGSVQVNISPDYYGTGATVLAYESELRYPLSDTIEVSGGLGYQASRNALNHDDLYSNVGIAWFILPNLTLDLRYHDLHEMNERPYGHYESDPLYGYHLDTPVTLSASIGL